MLFHLCGDKAIDKGGLSGMKNEEVDRKEGLNWTRALGRSSGIVGNRKRLCLCDWDRDGNDKHRADCVNFESSTISSPGNKKTNSLFFANRFLKNKQLKECSFSQKEFNPLLPDASPTSSAKENGSNFDKSFLQKGKSTHLKPLFNSKSASQSKESQSLLINPTPYPPKASLASSRSLVNGVYSFHLKYMNKKTPQIGVDHSNLIQSNYNALKLKNNQRALDILRKNNLRTKQGNDMHKDAKPLKKDVAISANFPTISSSKHMQLSTRSSPINAPRRDYDHNLLRDREIMMALRKSKQEYLQKRIILFNKELNKVI